MSSTAFPFIFKLNYSKQTQVVCTILGLQTFNRFGRFVPFSSFPWRTNALWKKKKNLISLHVCLCSVRGRLQKFFFSPLESERLASVCTTKKWGMSPGWNLLSISSMISLMCLLPTATKMLLAACCQSGMTSWGTGREKKLRKVIPDLPSVRKGRLIDLSYCTFDRVISSEAKEIILFILG